MALSDIMKDVPPSAFEVISILLGVIFSIIKNQHDEAVQEEALMRAQEAIKAYLDTRKFVRTGPPSGG